MENLQVWSGVTPGDRHVLVGSGRPQVRRTTVHASPLQARGSGRGGPAVARPGNTPRPERREVSRE